MSAETSIVSVYDGTRLLGHISERDRQHVAHMAAGSPARQLQNAQGSGRRNLCRAPHATDRRQTMTAVVLPFPLVRRRAFVLRNAARMAKAQPKTAEKLLVHAIDVQAQTMARRGIAPDLIAREAKALETAIRCELCRLTILGDTA